MAKIFTGGTGAGGITTGPGDVDTNTPRVTLGNNDISVEALHDLKSLSSGVTVEDSGQLLTCTLADITYYAGVTSSGTYRVTAVNGIIYLGIADVTIDANILWTIPAGDTQIITIPAGIGDNPSVGEGLAYRSDAALVYGRLARIS